MIKSIIVVVALISTVYAAKCPNLEVFPNLDLNKYLGKWYEIERFPFIQEDNLRCIAAEYTLDGSSIKVNNSGININTGDFTAQIGKAVVKDPNEPSKIVVTFFGIISADYWVIDTDYDYSLVYSCKDLLFGLFKFEYAWILSRNRNLDASVVNKLKDKLKSQGIDTSKFLHTDQSKCN